MEKRESNASASAGSQNQREKKEKKFLRKMRSLRERVTGIKDDIKEKTTNLRRQSAQFRKKIKLKDRKNNDSSSDSNSEEESSDAKSPSLAVASADEKLEILPSSPSSLSKDGKEVMTSTITKASSGQAASNDPTITPSDDRGNAAKYSPASSRSSGNESNTNDSDYIPEEANMQETPKPYILEPHKKPRIHIAFDGVTTIDAIFNRIDETFENCEIAIDGPKEKIGLTIQKISKTSKSSNVEKKNSMSEDSEDHKENNEEDDEEPIVIDYREIQTIEDLLSVLNHQPGSRRIRLKSYSDDSDSVHTELSTNTSCTHSSVLAVNNDNKIESRSEDSLSKVDEDISTSDTNIKTSIDQDDKTNVNIESVQTANSFSDHNDDTVQQVPTVNEAKSCPKKRKAPVMPKPCNKNSQPETIVSSEKREIIAKDSNQNNDDESANISAASNDLNSRSKQTEDDPDEIFKTPENIVSSNFYNQLTSSRNTNEKNER